MFAEWHREVDIHASRGIHIDRQSQNVLTAVPRIAHKVAQGRFHRWLVIVIPEYTDDDMYWLEEIADQFGALIFAHNQEFKTQLELAAASSNEQKSISTQEMETEELLTTLAYRPDPALVKCVEDGFRNLHDYSKLGRSPLVDLFGIQGGGHIERGKLVQQKLIETLESLRPVGDLPSEPLPREWYSYTILHDAYVEDRPSRDIMAKLYISEGTYYRTRRRALRGVSRALVETGLTF